MCNPAKINMVLIHSMTWMNLENIMLNAKIVTQKATCMISFVGNIQNRQVHNEKKMFALSWKWMKM